MGQISDNKAVFEMSVNQRFAGKKGNLQIVSQNDTGESEPLIIPVTGPKIKSKPVPTKTVAPKQQSQSRVPEITCLKGATKRTFQAIDCPPGYTKG